MSNIEFIAGGDIMDSLRIECSAVTPYQSEKITKAGNEIWNAITEKYGIFIPASKIAKTGKISERCLVLDTPMFEALHYAWCINPRPGFYYPEVSATCFDDGMIVAFDDPTKSWDILSQETKNEGITRFGSEKDAKSVIAFFSLVNQIAHESIHQLHTKRMPVTMKECGAYYYQRQIIKDLHYSYIVNTLEEKRITFYSNLLTKYGDKLHQVFFGKTTNRHIRNEIIEVFLKRENMEELFPEGMGL